MNKDHTSVKNANPILNGFKKANPADIINKIYNKLEYNLEKGFITEEDFTIALSGLEKLEKGRKADPTGTRKTWGKVEYIKTASGWKASKDVKEAHDKIHGEKKHEVGKLYSHSDQHKNSVWKFVGGDIYSDGMTNHKLDKKMISEMKEYKKENSKIKDDKGGESTNPEKGSKYKLTEHLESKNGKYNTKSVIGEHIETISDEKGWERSKFKMEDGTEKVFYHDKIEGKHSSENNDGKDIDVIGKTRSGKQIHGSHDQPANKDFDAQDHLDAAQAHGNMREKERQRIIKKNGDNKQQTVKDMTESPVINYHDDERQKHLNSYGAKIEDKKKDNSLYGSTEKKLKKINTEGSILTFKEGQGRKQIAVKSVEKNDKGEIKIKGPFNSETKSYKNMDELINVIDWDQMEKWHNDK